MPLSTPNRTQHMQDMGIEDPEAIYPTYDCAYYVQSPSTMSHANSTDYVIHRNNTEDSALFHETNTLLPNTNNQHQQEASRFSTLSRYSSSRGSSHSFLHEKKVSQFDGQSHIDTSATETINPEKRLIVVDGNNIGNDGDNSYIGTYVYYHSRSTKVAGHYGWWRYLSFRHSSSSAWILLQIGWRLLVSLAVALLVFYIATKPPNPKISAKVSRIPEFVLGEGVDSTGVTTKILTCNCSIKLLVENKSKLFRLHIHPIDMALLFDDFPLAASQGPELYAGSHGLTSFQLYVGIRSKPMYGAGRSMQDLVDSGKGLPLIIRASLASSFHVVRGLINPTFRHHLQCLFVLGKTHDKRHQTQLLNSSSCTITY